MANSLLKDVHTLVDQVVEETDMMAGWTKGLPVFEFGDVEGQRYDDIEYLPEDFRFEAQDGYKSNKDNTDAQSLTDRLIPIRRNKAFNIKTSIETKELRDPRLRDMAVKGFAREIRNKIDVYCYRKAIERAQMVQKISGSAITQADCSAAEVLMMDSGLSMYQKNLFLSLPHYKELSDKLALNQYHGGLPQNSYERATIPNMIAGFDRAMRADYRLTLGASTATGVTVSGDQKHTVETKDSNDNYVDNRQMVLAVSDGSNFKEGDKFTIAGVNRLNPEVREDTSELMTFTVLGKTGNNLTISPAIIVDGPYKNVTAQAADTSAITVLNDSASNPSIFYAEDSIKIIPGNLPVEGGGVDKVDASTEQGLPMRFTYWYNPDDEVMYMKAVVFFDCEVWLPNQVGVII